MLRFPHQLFCSIALQYQLVWPPISLFLQGLEYTCVKGWVSFPIIYGLRVLFIYLFDYSIGIPTLVSLGIFLFIYLFLLEKGAYIFLNLIDFWSFKCHRDDYICSCMQIYKIIAKSINSLPFGFAGVLGTVACKELFPT